MPPLQPPGPGPAPSWGTGYDSVYPVVGLSSLVQGLSQGIQLGHQFNQQAEDLGLRRLVMQNEASYRNAMLKDRGDHEKDLITQKRDMLAYLKENAANKDENAKRALDDKEAAALGKKKKDQALDNVAAAYEGMDNLQGIGDQFIPESSAGGYAKAPLEWIQSHAMPQSLPNQFKDQNKSAATLVAVAEGGRMSDEKVKAAMESMGGSGIGESKGSFHDKLERQKDQLALRAGVSRQEVDEYIASVKGHGGGATPPPSGPIHTYKSGRKAQWNGSAWVPLP